MWNFERLRKVSKGVFLTDWAVSSAHIPKGSHHIPAKNKKTEPRYLTPQD